MKDEIKEILEYVLSLTYGNENAIKGINKVEDYITNLQDTLQDREEYIGHLEELCDKYEEEHSITFKEWVFDKRENERLKLELSGYREAILRNDELLGLQDYKSRIDKANTLLDELLKIAYIDGEYIMYDYSTSELLEVKQALQGEDKDE